VEELLRIWSKIVETNENFTEIDRKSSKLSRICKKSNENRRNYREISQILVKYLTQMKQQLSELSKISLKLNEDSRNFQEFPEFVINST